ncbi:rubredoxin-like domain-containing protein [Desulforhopalus sp. 52FAK]
MSEWECGVCGYLHKEDGAPEKCPVCEAPEKMFTEKHGEVEQVEDQTTAADQAEVAAVDTKPTVDMIEWECGVCGYLHKEDGAPEKCPVCEAPEKMFTEKHGVAGETEEIAPGVEKIEEQAEVIEEKETLPDKQWRCTVSGYLHTGPVPPEKCPVCEATAEEFEEVVEPEEEVIEKPVATDSDKRWRCTVCGYIHEAETPPEKCPLCGADKSLFVEIDADGNVIGGGEEDVSGEGSVSSSGTGVEDSQVPATFFDTIAKLVLKFHLHPIHTHFPNGILPAMVAFLAIGIFFNITALETAAFFNAIAVLVMLPMVIFTGYVEWQRRYNGLKSALFITKILCSLIVLASVNVLVFWRIIDPTVAAEGSSTQLIYLGVAGGALAAAGIAGHLGGKLVFAGRH